MEFPVEETARTAEISCLLRSDWSKNFQIFAPANQRAPLHVNPGISQIPGIREIPIVGGQRPPATPNKTQGHKTVKFLTIFRELFQKTQNRNEQAHRILT